MKASEKLILAGLVILVGAAIAGLILTRSSSDSEAARGGRRTPSADRAPGIDRRTFETAQKLSGLAVTEEEERLAPGRGRVECSAERGPRDNGPSTYLFAHVGEQLPERAKVAT